MVATQWVYVWYAGENQWQQQLNLGRIALSRSDHMICEADADLYIFSLLDNPDNQASRFETHAMPPPLRLALVWPPAVAPRRPS
eukprot:1844999-Pyramimonas_sp.AAC.1